MTQVPMLNGGGELNKKKVVLAFALIATFLVASAYSAGVFNVGAQRVKIWIYSAKFVCSINTDLHHPSPFGLVPGVYETDINVHNPSSTTTLDITKKVVVALDESVPPPSPVRLGVKVLGPDLAFRIDCTEIQAALAATCVPPLFPPYCTATGGLITPIKGFVGLITISPDLDVVAVYTTAPVNTVCTTAGCATVPGNVTSIEVVTVAPKPFS